MRTSKRVLTWVMVIAIAIAITYFEFAFVLSNTLFGMPRA